MSSAVVADLVLSLVSGVVFLGIAVGAFIVRGRVRTEPVAWPLSLLGATLFAYTLFNAIVDLHAPQSVWERLSNASAALALPIYYHLVLAFVGRRLVLRQAILGMYLASSVLVIASLVPVSTRLWAIGLTGPVLVAMVHATVELARHLRSASGEERARTRLVLASALVAGLSNLTDLADLAGISMPRLGSFGLLVSAVVLAAVALRLLEGLSLLTWVNAAAIAAGVVVAEVGIINWVADRVALGVVATVLVALAALLASRFVVADYTAFRERTLAHASLGRLAAQMAHDIRNPLASIRGATQFLAGERAEGRSIDGQGEFLTLLVEQVDRATRIVDQYQRIGRAEPVWARASLNEAVKEAAKFLASTVKVSLHLDETLPSSSFDFDLVVIALENVLRNAHEAAPDKPLTVLTGQDTTLFATVKDEGPGMNARTRERALEGFFTTRSQGSGLGLAFVRRVVEAHSGRLLIDSREGVGTTVRLELPVEPPPRS